MAQEKKKTKSESEGFSVDSDTTGIKEMPTISVLLKRKKLNKSVGNTDQTNTKTQTSPLKVKDPTQKIETSDPTDPIQMAIPEAPSRLIEIDDKILPPHTPTVKVTRSERSKNEKTPPPKILLWDSSSLNESPDPLAKGLVYLLKNGADRALFLAIGPTDPSSQRPPAFVATAGVSPRAQSRVWRGLVWEPTIVPELWNTFVRTGTVELPPPGPNTQITSDRNVVRAAMGAESNEWITLVRVGPVESCRGILVLFSNSSILGELVRAAAWLQQKAELAAA